MFFLLLSLSLSCYHFFSVMRESVTYKTKQGAEVHYAPEKDYEDDNIKIFHLFTHAETGKFAFHLDWSPYDSPSENDLLMWFSLECPSRFSIGDDLGAGNLDTERLTNALGKQLCIEGF